MSWIILAFGSVFFFTSMNLLQRIIAVDSKNHRATSILFNTIAALFAVLISVSTGLFRNFVLPTAPKAWVALLIACLFYALYEKGRFVAAKLLDASILTTVGNISVLVAFIGALFLYSETLTFKKLIGAILIIGALLLVSINQKAKKSSKKGILIAVAISIMLGLGWMLDKLGTQFFNANTYSILVWVISTVFICLPPHESKCH